MGVNLGMLGFLAGVIKRMVGIVDRKDFKGGGDSLWET